MNKPYRPFTERHPQSYLSSVVIRDLAPTDEAEKRRERAEQAMRRNDLLIGMVCGNMLTGRDAFFGTGQFIEDEDTP